MSPDVPDFSRQRVLVTGGAGFIGSALTWALNQHGCTDIVVADLLGMNEKWRNLVPLRFADCVDVGDTFLADLRAGALGRFDLVLHLGACSATTERDASYLLRNNYAFTRDLAAWALDKDIRFVYASSAATYGLGEQGMDDDDSEAYLRRLRPLNMYGYSKHLFDLYAAKRGWLDAIVGIKYFNIFGPNDAHKGDMRSLVTKGFDQVRETGRLRLFKSLNPAYADGHQRRDFHYVKDAAAMTLHLAATDTAHGLFNIASGRAHTWLDLADALFAALARPAQVEFIDMPEALHRTYQYDTKGGIGKLRATGYASEVTPLAAAVRDCVTGYLLPDRRLGDEALSS